MAASHVNALSGGVVRARGVNGARSAHPRGRESQGASCPALWFCSLGARFLQQACDCSAPCAGTFPSENGRRATPGESWGVLSPRRPFDSCPDRPTRRLLVCGMTMRELSDHARHTSSYAEDEGRTHEVRSRQPRDGRLSAPLAERWYWQSDGGSGLFVLAPTAPRIGVKLSSSSACPALHVPAVRRTMRPGRGLLRPSRLAPLPERSSFLAVAPQVLYGRSPSGISDCASLAKPARRSR
jgi:hypothetical protein